MLASISRRWMYVSISFFQTKGIGSPYDVKLRLNEHFLKWDDEQVDLPKGDSVVYQWWALEKKATRLKLYPWGQTKGESNLRMLRQVGKFPPKYKLPAFKETAQGGKYINDGNVKGMNQNSYT